MNPNDKKTGSVYSFQVSPKGEFRLIKQITWIVCQDQSRQLPLTLTHSGGPGYLVCGFGNNAGALLWFDTNDKGETVERSLRSLPGAIKTYVE